MKFRRNLCLIVAHLFIVSGIARGASYRIDPNHSKISFQVRHLGISKVEGVFKTFSGVFDYDPDKIAGSVVSATIDTASINTDQEERDKHLKSKAFLDVEKYPTMTFVSTKSKPGKTADRFTVLGNLTLHGITKPVRLEVEAGGTVKDPWGNERAGFSATTRINRQDFGLTFNKVLETGQLIVGNEITIGLQIEGIKKK